MTSDGTAKTDNDWKLPREKTKTLLLSFIYFCLGFALSACVLRLLLGYDSTNMFVDFLSLPEITVHVTVGGGIVLAHVLTRKPRKRASWKIPLRCLCNSVIRATRLSVLSV